MSPEAPTTVGHSPTAFPQQHASRLSAHLTALSPTGTRCRCSQRRSCCTPDVASLGGLRRPPRPTLGWCSSCPSCRPASASATSSARPQSMVVPHTCRRLPPAPAEDEVCTSLSFPPSAPARNHLGLAGLDRATPVQVEDTTSTTTIPSSASALIPSARKGMTGPQMASLLQVKFDTGGRRCVHAQHHPAHGPTHTKNGCRL